MSAIRCACGAVSGDANPVKEISGVCHCVTCRKWSGGAFMGVSCDAVHYDDEGALSVWVSSDYGERVSCKVCSAPLEWRMRDGSHHSVSVQLFEDPARFPMRSEIFIDEKPEGYDFAGDHERLTRAQVMKAHGADQEAP